MLLEEFVEKRSSLRKISDELVAALNEVNLKEDQRMVRDQISRLDQSRFNVLVMGQLKRGKSTLVNVLLRKPEMLPSGVIPVSSAVVSIGHGEPEEATVHFKEGRSEVGSLESIKDFCVEENNPKNEKGVSSIDIQIAHPWLEDGIHIVDTPGAGSVESYHAEITYQYIPTADVILFVFTSDMPISEGERQFLDKIAQHGQRKVIFVLNKADRLAESQVTEVLDYNLAIIRQQQGFEDVQIGDFFPVSSTQAMEAIRKEEKPPEESGFPRLEARIAKLITEERTAIAIGQAAHGMRDAVNSLHDTLQMENSLISEKTEEIEARIRECNEKAKQFKGARSENLEDIKSGIRKAKKRLKRRKMQDVESVVNEEWKSKLNEASFWRRFAEPAELQAELAGTVMDLVSKEFHIEVEEITEEILEPIFSKIESELEDEIEELSDFSNGLSVQTEHVNAISWGSGIGTFAGLGMATGGGIWTGMTFGGQGLLASMGSALFGYSASAMIATVLAPALMATGGLAVIAVTAKQYSKNQRKMESALAEAVKSLVPEAVARINEDLDDLADRAKVLFERLERHQFEPIEQALRAAQEEKADITKQGRERRERLLEKCEELRGQLESYAA